MPHRSSLAGLALCFLLSGCGGIYEASRPVYNAVVSTCWENHLISGEHGWHSAPGAAIGMGVQMLLVVPAMPFMLLEMLLGSDGEKDPGVTKAVVFSVSGLIGTAVSAGAFALTLPAECAAQAEKKAEPEAVEPAVR